MCGEHSIGREAVIRNRQYQKTHVQSSEALAYLARFLFNLASLRRFRISWYSVSRPS